MNQVVEDEVMSRNKIIEDVDLDTNEMEFQDDVDGNVDVETSKQDTAKARRRIDELMEKKRLKELLDEDEWEL